MDLRDIKRTYPDIELEELFPLFPRISMSDYPELGGYSWEDAHMGKMGPGGLFLASDMAKKMELRTGMRVLDLGPGRCASSLFLAKHYGVQVVAADLWIDPSDNWERVKKGDLMGSVIPLKVDARAMPFAEGYFDAVFCMGSYFYFGTDDMFLSYLTTFIRPSARICVGGPCYADELTSETPKEFLFGESNAYHSPKWWKHHFEKSGLVDVLHCDEHPKGRELWLDDTRWDLEECHPRDRQEGWRRDSILQSIEMLLTDKERFVTHFILLAEKK